MISRARVWDTSLSALECRQRLQDYSEPDGISRLLGSDSKRTVYASIRPESFRLFAKGPAFFGNLYEPYFYGSLVEVDGRTAIRGRFRVHPFALVYVTAWFFFVVTIGGFITVVMSYEILTGRRVSHGSLHPALAVFIGPAMLLFGVSLAVLGWRMGRSQRDRIERFLETTLLARPLTSR